MPLSVEVDRWPAGTPPEVSSLAGRLVEVLKGRSGQVVGPALSLVFAYTVAELGDAPLEQVA
jgi:hypothetical protein